ncbi:MAG TPA: hypothetical protein VIN04_12470 [Myxococcota bacterium]
MPVRSATLEPGFWQLELRANGAGDLAWRASGFDPEAPCAEEEWPWGLTERLYVLPRDGTPALLAATDMPAPGDETLTIRRLFFRLRPPIALHGLRPAPWLVLGADGGVSFTAELASEPCPSDPIAGVRRALFAPDGAGGATLIALAGEPLPDAEGEEVLRVWNVGLADDGLGSILARVDYHAPDAESQILGTLPRSALLRWRPLAGELTTVAREGAPSAFFAGEALDFEEPRASTGGAVALLGAPAEGALAIWVGDADGLEPAVPLSGPVPGAPDGAAFVTHIVPLMDPPLVNDAGEVAFVTWFVPGPGEDEQRGLFGPGEDGAPTLRMATGDPAPGFPELQIAMLRLLHLAPNGALLVRAELTAEPLLPPGGWLSSETRAAWYLVPRSGPPRLLVRDGGPIELEPNERWSAHVLALAHDEALTRLAIQIGGWGGPTAIAVRTVPEPCAPLAGACALAALALRASGRRARRPIRSACRAHASSAA